MGNMEHQYGPASEPSLNSFSQQESVSQVEEIEDVDSHLSAASIIYEPIPVNKHEGDPAFQGAEGGAAPMNFATPMPHGHLDTIAHDTPWRIAPQQEPVVMQQQYHHDPREAFNHQPGYMTETGYAEQTGYMTDPNFMHNGGFHHDPIGKKYASNPSPATTLIAGLLDKSEISTTFNNVVNICILVVALLGFGFFMYSSYNMVNPTLTPVDAAKPEGPFNKKVPDSASTAVSWLFTILGGAVMIGAILITTNIAQDWFS